jgi:hypothetical protein
MLAYGRLPNELEIQIGLDYLHNEPMKEYEENKNKPKPDTGKRKGGGPDGASAAPDAAAPAAVGEGPGTGPSAPMPPSAMPKVSELTKPAPAANAGAMPPEMPSEAAADTGGAEGGTANEDMGMGMMAGMAGMGRRGQGPAKPVEVKYEPSAWGRYAKVLLSSTEFTFIN